MPDQIPFLWTHEPLVASEVPCTHERSTSVDDRTGWHSENCYAILVYESITSYEVLGELYRSSYSGADQPPRSRIETDAHTSSRISPVPNSFYRYLKDLMPEVGGGLNKRSTQHVTHSTGLATPI